MQNSSSDAVVVGNSLVAYAAAMQLASVNLKVTLIAPKDSTGSASDARPVTDATGLITNFLAQNSAKSPQNAAITALPVKPELWLPPAVGGTQFIRVPEPQLGGIMAAPLTSAAKKLLGGTKNSARAYFDRFKPVLTLGKTQSLLELVKVRQGKTAAALIAPGLRTQYATDPHKVLADLALPGINTALTRTGSLSGAVLTLSAAAASAKIVPRQGWRALKSALAHKLELYNVNITRDEKIISVHRADRTATAPDNHPHTVTTATTTLHTRAVIFVPCNNSELREFSALCQRIPQRNIAELYTLAATAKTPQRLPAEFNKPGARAVTQLQNPDFSAPVTLEISSLAPQHSDLVAARIISPDENTITGLAAASATTRAIAATYELALTAAWQLENLPAAHGTSAEKDTAHWLQQELCEPTTLFLGEIFYGGELAPALADSTARAVELRRLLLGIN
ncbi:hypothetical protein KJY78_05985 [Canibacter sp. lx-45]|uniref:hypothetical protein n=1 Tax=Canibacter zhuwentaonis TaxID=2837491 RepID=UPI001BDC88FC|nr:hypothetical protein [Canibacter zhuwentaonis]MBT1035892.1 hypothetical protein [Canibacter zhuwentaonis]